MTAQIACPSISIFPTWDPVWQHTHKDLRGGAFVFLGHQGAREVVSYRISVLSPAPPPKREDELLDTQTPCPPPCPVLGVILPAAHHVQTALTGRLVS